MILIDIFRNGNSLYAWLWDRGNIFKEIIFYPKIYALCNDLRKLKKYYPYAKYVEKRTLNGYRRVLEISTSIKNLRKLTFDIKKRFHYNIELFNSDIPLEEHYLALHNLFPTARVELNTDIQGKIRFMQSRESVFDTYTLPLLKLSTLSIKTSHSLRRLDAKILFITFDNTKLSGDTMTGDFVDLFQKTDCDILIAKDIDLIFLLKEIRKQFPLFSFSRFGRDHFSDKGISCVSYGQVIYKDAAVYLKGRLHFSKKPVLYGNWALEYPFEVGRLCRIPVQKANHRSVGYGVGSLQIYYALKKQMLIPNTSVCVERWKSGLELFNADRGAFIYEPKIGFHTDIAEIDFISLFPNIMVHYNISTETLFCPCCKGNRVPGLDINICRHERGIIPEMLEPLIQQRLKYKKEGTLLRADALKGLLVTSFGYMGFRKSRFARIESHQAIQAYAREILLGAAHIAEELDFSVVHGIVDSLWVKKKDITEKEVLNLISEIKARLGFEAKLEGLYRWIVFLPSTQNKDVPVATRYYGVFLDGEVKVRGVALRRHDTPMFIKDFQADVINELAIARNEFEFIDKINTSKKLLRETIVRLATGRVPRSELTIVKRLTKMEFKVKTPMAVISNKLQKKGYAPEPGQYLKYIIGRGKNYTADDVHYDVDEYIRLLKRAFDELFIPFNIVRTLYDCTGVKAKEVSVCVKERTG